MASEKENAVLKNILAMIAKAEGTTKREGNPYDAIVGFGAFLKPGDLDPARKKPTANKPVSQMTFKEVKDFGRALVNATKGTDKNGDPKIGDNSDGSSAVGKYQLLANNFNTKGDGVVGNLQKKLRARGVKGFKDTDIFDERAQDLLAIELLKENDGKLNGQKILTNYINNPNKETLSKLMDKIGSKWEGVPTNSERKFTKNELNYKEAIDMVRLPESQYEFVGADESGLRATKNKPPTRNQTDDQMSDLGLSSDKNVLRTVARLHNILKEKQTIKTLKEIQNAKDILAVVGTGTTSKVVDKLLKSKNIEKEIDKLDNNDTFSIYNYLRDAVNEIIGVKPAGASEKFNMDGIKTLQEKFKDMAVSMGPVIDTSEDTKRRIPDPAIISEEARSPDMIGDTSSIDAPLVSYGGDKVGTAPELQVSDMDNLEETQILFDPEKRREVRTSIQSGDSRTDRPNKITGEPQERRSMPLARPPEDLAEFPESDNFAPNLSDDLAEFPESDDFSPNYSIVDSIPMEDANEIGSGNELDPERNREPRERSEVDFDYFADEAQPMGGEFEGDDIDAGSGPVDFSFIKSLFSGGFDAGRDSESELNIGADYFYDEAQPLGGEADPNEDVLRFDEGGTADFDGKKEEEDDEGDPPPLAKPEEVADDIPAMLSEGEYVLPANVVRYLGLERIMDMHRQVLSEIQQMEDLGMIQNVDKNGEPEEDDKEMKFLKSEEPEEGEEAVSKGTLIIASSKPKGMMCPEPLEFYDGGTPDGGPAQGQGTDDPGAGPGGPSGPSGPAGTGNPNDAGTPQEMNAPAGVDPFGGVTGTEAKDREKANEVTEVTSIDEFNTIEDLEKAREKEKSKTELDRAFEDSKKGLVERGLYGLGKLGELMGVEVTEARAKAREAAEAEASQPGDSDDDELDGNIEDKDIKVNKVNDVIADLKNKNVYIPGVGYFPLQGLMSPQDTTIV